MTRQGEGAMRRSLRFVFVAAAIVTAWTFVITADERPLRADAALQLQMGALLFDETRFHEALQAYDLATLTDIDDVAVEARKGKIRSALRVADFSLARREGDVLRAQAPQDPEAIALNGDALWSAGLFDEADREYVAALALAPESSRARFGHARSLATLSRLDEALDEALAASAAAPRDGEIHAMIGAIYERMNRFDQAANSYRNYINLLPNRDRSEKAAWARSQVEFLDSFRDVVPVQIDDEALNRLHTLPFRLVNDKIIVQARVNGGRPQDFVLDTGAEQTVISRETARRERIRAVASTLSAGVGEIGLRGLELGRVRSLDLGTLQVRNLPVIIKNPGLRGMPRREGESFSPLSLGLSMMIDYENQLLTIGRTLPEVDPDFSLPMRIHRLAMVRGKLNAEHPAYFVVDTGGEVISISTDTARRLPPSPYRRIPLLVYGTSGWDRDAFLMPGVDLDFDRIEYRNFPLVVLNLRAPSILLGFELGGIIGHKFLEQYRVSMDMAASELRLEKF
jgi:hypothetical protein